MKADFPNLDGTLSRALLAAQQDTPGQEICGFLVERLSTLTFRRIPNLGGAGEFWIDQDSLDRILKDIERSSSSVKAFVHSHHSGVRLSASDEASLRSSPWPWLVVVYSGTEIQGEWFWIEAEDIRSEKMMLV